MTSKNENDGEMDKLQGETLELEDLGYILDNYMHLQVDRQHQT